jgi:hypothetical protein
MRNHNRRDSTKSMGFVMPWCSMFLADRSSRK